MHQSSLILWYIAIKLALKALRGGFKGFRIFILAIALGVAAIASVLSISGVIERSIEGSGKSLLGGDITVSMTHEKLTDPARIWLQQHSSQLSDIRTMRTLGVFHDKRTLINLKAVDRQYPLVGTLQLSHSLKLVEALQQSRHGYFGVVLSGNAMRALGAKVGDLISIGEHQFELRAELLEEPDRSVNMLAFRPRAIISIAGLGASELEQPGSLIRNTTRVLLEETPQDSNLNHALQSASQTSGSILSWVVSLWGQQTKLGSLDSWKDKFKQAFPDAGWRIRDHRNVSPGLNRFIERVRTFLTLASLTALLVGGLGIVGALKAHIERQRSNLAILRCMGASGGLVSRFYVVHIGILALFAIAIGLGIGAMVPLFGESFLSNFLQVEILFSVDYHALLVAGCFGVLNVMLFAYPALGQILSVSPASLFQLAHTNNARALTSRVIIVSTMTVVGLMILVILNTDDIKTAVGFVGAIAGSFGVLYLLSWVVLRWIKFFVRFQEPVWKMAVQNLLRLNSNATLSIVSLGLGLTVLGSVLLIERNLGEIINNTTQINAPSHYFIDIQSNQRERFHEIVDRLPDVRSSESVPMMRGRITHFNDVEIEQLDPPKDFEWILRGDRGITWMREQPTRGSKVVEGQWWDATHQGKTQLSFDAEAAEAFGLQLGDTITVKVLGRSLTAPITNLRQIKWDNFDINFVLVFSPGFLDRAPHTFLATVYTHKPISKQLEDAIFKEMPNITPIQVDEILGRVLQILAALGFSVRLIAGLAIVVGVLVLAGALIATQERRIYEATILKVLGGQRKRVLGSFLIEFSIIGFVAALTSSVLSIAGAWALATYIMKIEFILDIPALAIMLLISVVIAIATGLIAIGHSLNKPALRFLRNA